MPNSGGKIINQSINQINAILALCQVALLFVYS